MDNVAKVHRFTSPWVGLGLVLLSFVIRLMNATITSTELPALERDLDVAGPTAELTMTLFLAVAGALVAPFGMLADKYGRVRVFSYGTAGMLVANFGSAIAPNFPFLLATRILEAVAFPAMGVASLALVAGAFTDPKPRARAFAAYGACYGLAIAMAGVLGGLFVAELSWRWSFAMNLPFLLVALIGVNVLLRSDDDPHAEREFDGGGALFLVVGISAVLIWLQRLPLVGLDVVSVVTFLIGLAALVLFVVWERARSARGRQVIIDPKLFSSVGFHAASATCALMMFGAFAVLTVLPLYWILVGEADPLAVGFGLMPLGLGWSCGSILAVPLANRFGARLAVVGSLIFSAVMLAGVAVMVSETGSTIPTMLPLFGSGVGLGVGYSRLNEAGLQNVPDRYTGLGAGVLIGFRFVGAALGAALLAQGMMLSATQLAKSAIDEASLPQLQTDELKRAVESAGRGRYGPLLTEENRSDLAPELSDAYANGARLTLLFAAGSLAAAGLAARRLRRRVEQIKRPNSQ